MMLANNRRTYFPWWICAGVGTALTGRHMAMPPEPMGDEINQTLALGALLLFVGTVAALFRASVSLNAIFFAVLFWSGHLSLWFKVARNYHYSPFGEQFWNSLFLVAGFFVLLVVSSRFLRSLIRIVRGSQRPA